MSDRDSGLGDMSPDEFRRAGYLAVDWVADYLASVEDYPVLARTEPGAIRRLLPASPPKTPESLESMLADLTSVIVPGITHWNHPAFFAYFAITGSGPGILGELLTAALNVNGMLWKTSPAFTELEEHVLDWLRQMLGLPADFKGIVYDTASTSTFHAFAAARELAGEGAARLRAYTSGQAHSSVEKAAMAIGLGRRGIVKIDVDEN